MRAHALTAEVLSSHDAFRSVFADAADAAVHLVVDPRNPDASAQRSAARRFVRMSLAHMAEEEARVFPRALRSGIARDVVARLYEDHRELRAFALEVDTRLGGEELDDAGALAFLRYVRGFEQHVQREEWSLATGGAC